MAGGYLAPGVASINGALSSVVNFLSEGSPRLLRGFVERVCYGWPPLRSPKALPRGSSLGSAG